MQAYRIDQRINSKLEQIISLRELATKATATLGGGVPNATKNIRSMESAISKMVDLESEINADIDELIELKREIVQIIKSIENPEYQTLLELRYLCFDCAEKEKQDKDYDKAVHAELDEIRKGNYNFKGIKG